MSKKKYALKKFFRQGLAVIGEKKVFQKNYAVASLSVSGESDLQTYAWTKFQIPLRNIVQGVGKNNRIGTKIYVRYVTWDMEIYGTSE